MAIYVLAGVNGAGKSSLGGAIFRARGADYFNPDEAARRVLALHPHPGQTEANARAWALGKSLLEKAIARRLNFAFETTLGGKTIAGMLAAAASSGCEIFVWYAGLASVDLHLARVRARVKSGGHDIPEADIRRRWNRSRENLIALLPVLTGLRVFDNSTEADPKRGRPPRPVLILEMEKRRILGPREFSATPDWAKPIVAAAWKMCR